jgi:cytochrome b561
MSASSAPFQRYTGVAIALHWLVAALVVGQVAWGWWMQEIPKAPPGPRAEAFNLHKSFGLLILALMVARLGWRLSHPPPRLPAMAAWQRALANATHGLLYVALFALPLTGYLGSAYSGYPVKFFGAVLPAWATKDASIKELMGTLHLAASWVLVAAVLVHLAGALRHGLVDRDGLLRRMMPGPRAP